ncbi:hypothetical protein MUO56_04270 [Candidatus Bathyarchaeota archaeon]|nr:hypothetical protein [Candidatus Bathyarchaeota archaeon]
MKGKRVVQTSQILTMTDGGHHRDCLPYLQVPAVLSLFDGFPNPSPTTIDEFHIQEVFAFGEK